MKPAGLLFHCSIAPFYDCAAVAACQQKIPHSPAPLNEIAVATLLISSCSPAVILTESHMSEPTFLSDIQTIRNRARQHIEEGAVTSSYGADRETVLKLLNEALATEIVCTLRYRRHYFMATGINSQSVADEFLEHSNEEQQHADRIAERIVQLGGEPNFSPEGLTLRSHAEYVEADSLVDMIKENLVAERIAIDSYSEIVRYLGDKDPTSRRMMEEILAVEEEHAEDMSDLLADIHGSAAPH
jgi:bacterioferritin